MLHRVFLRPSLPLIPSPLAHLTKVLWLTSVAWSLLSVGCVDPFNPCATLAERICQCEASVSARESCRQVRIEALRNKVDISDEERDQCWDKLGTCDCEDLEENRVEECGFVRE